MKTIIAGSRSFTTFSLMCTAMATVEWKITEVVSGHAPGADKLGEAWARKNKIPIKLFIADWESFGKAAGFLRNEEMGQYAEALVAFWDGKSRGTKHMICFAQAAELKVKVFNA